MSCHLSRRLTPVHRAVSMALLCSVGWAALVPSVQAATVGKTVVTSAQHEPLSASIVFTDIRAADFSASLANPVVYQQMGLTPTDSMRVSFQATSATSGQVFISTSQPVSKPFADLVLAINDNGQQNVVPKTLLMPLNASLPIDNTSKNAVTGAKKPNLPSVSTSTAKPLTVRRGAPPPLLSASGMAENKPSTAQASTTELPAPSIQTPAVTATAQTSNLAYAPSRLDNGRLNSSADIKNNSNNSDTINTNRGSVSSLDSSSILDKALNDKQLDTLSIQVTRQIQPSSKTDAKSALVPTPNDSASHVNDSDAVTAAAPVSNKPVDNATSKATSKTSANDSTASRSTAQYQVQRNDSLWVIAQQIAQENNLDTPTVMKQIQSQNPDAFINKNADQLKADAKLSLPSYDVIPSQKNLEAAISAQRQHRRSANTPVVKKATKAPSKKRAKTTQAPKQRKKPMITKTQTLPKAQFSVLAPGHNGNADGTQAKSASNTGNGLSTDILATLKASRQQAAAQAKRLSKTSNALNSYTRKIQLQNQKLAELQARLKKLRNQ